MENNTKEKKYIEVWEALKKALAVIRNQIKNQRPDVYLKIKYADACALSPAGPACFVIWETPKCLGIFPAFWKSRSLLAVKCPSQNRPGYSYEYEVLDKSIVDIVEREMKK